MPDSAKRVWFLVVPRTSMINVAGPWEVLGHANDSLGREAYQLEVFGPTAPAVRTRFGLTLGGLRPIPSRLDNPPHTVVVAGGSPADPIPEDHEPLVPWLRRHRPRISTVVSIPALGPSLWRRRGSSTGTGPPPTACASTPCGSGILPSASSTRGST